MTESVKRSARLEHFFPDLDDVRPPPVGPCEASPAAVLVEQRWIIRLPSRGLVLRRCAGVFGVVAIAPRPRFVLSRAPAAVRALSPPLPSSS